MKFDFTGKVALVTGATRGIGKQIAEDLETLGAELILTGTNRNEIEELNKQSALTEQAKKRYFCVEFKCTETINEFVEELKLEYSKIDICVNNAGINKIDYIWETEQEDFENILSVNLAAPFMITREVSRMMKTNGYGRIVNISSIFGIISRVKRSMYSVSKFGLNGLTLASSNELAQYNVLVNAISPGFVLTDLTKSILSKNEIEELSKQVPIGRFAEPGEISKAVIFLASDMNTYISGQNIVVDGGYINV